MTALVKKYYAGYGLKEWKRLAKNPFQQLEFNTSMYFLKKYLPKKGLILDAGGGPGRYTIALAKSGYEVILLDLTPKLLEIAKRKIKEAKVQGSIRNIVEGSITDLSEFADNTFDAVICLGGPLSHVINAKDRDKAISELVRVAKKGAPILVSVMSRFGVLANELKLFQHEIEQPLFRKICDTGDYPGGYGFTACHFFLPEELKEDFARKNIDVLEMVGLEGLGSALDEKINKLAKNKKRWKIWLETHYKFCTHPAVVGMSMHFLIICEKK